MVSIRYFLIFLLFLSHNTLICQEDKSSSEEDFNEGIYFFNRGEYREALYYFKKLVDKWPDNSHFNFKVGECYLNIPGSEHLAVPYFEVATQKMVAKNDFRKRSFEEKNAPIHALFYLGNAYRMDDQIDKALESYNKFVDSPYFYGNYNLNIVENEIKSCGRAKIIQDTPVDYTKTNLGALINTTSSELHPVVSGNGKVLVFTRKLKFYDAILYSVMKEGQWSEPVNLNPQIKSDGEFIPTGLNYEGNKLLLIKVDGEISDIYLSALGADGIWTPAQKLQGRINSISQESHASFGLDDNSIIFSSNRSGGRGGFDLYISNHKEGLTWKRPKSLGKIINTEYDENTPQVCPNNKTLFFSSKGHYQMGGYDIFYSSLAGKNWETPLNIGYPINTTKDDLFYSPSGNCTVGYFSVKDESGLGEFDIFRLEIKSLSIRE